MFLACALTVAGCGAWSGGSDTPGSEDASRVSSPQDQPPADDWFIDATEATGLDFVHFNGMSGEFYMPEILGPGVALLDYDRDDDLDVFVVQGQMLGAGKTVDDALFPPARGSLLRHRLYRNDLQIAADGTRTVRLTDVTDESRIDARAYGFGAAAGDFDNDGWVDLYLTQFGRDLVYRNNGDGTFTEVSREIGIDDEAWSSSASFVDVNRDGWLDLYVGHYLRYRTDVNTRCFAPSGALDYCTPKSYQPLPDRLYLNRGDGTFVDATARAGIGREFGPTLGISTADFDRDGWVDIFVANDGREDQLWRNRHDGGFTNTALLAGVALPVTGAPEASMGVDAGDFDNDGDDDLFVTELTGEGSNLFVNDGSGTFIDESTPAGLGPASISDTGFGTAWFDYDNDGWLDILTVNGAVQAITALVQAGDPFPFHQRKQLYRNMAEGRFARVTDRAGATFERSDVGRGAAFGDLDNDGDTDIVVGNNNGPAQLLLNTVGNRNHWLGLRLVGGRSGRDMLGAEVEVQRADGTVLWRRARSDGSYASANDPRVLVGLGDRDDPVRVRVHWPDGPSSRVEEWRDVAVDRYATLVEGQGR